MRVSHRPLSLLVAAVLLGAGLPGCGGDDSSSADGERLTRAEYDLLVRQHREAKEAGEPSSAAQFDEFLTLARRHCKEISGSGPVVRATAPACDETVRVLETQVDAGTKLGACADEDTACVERELGRLVESFAGLATASERAAAAVEEVDAGDACREVLRGGPDLLDDVRELRDIGREMVTALRALSAAEGEAAAAAQDRFEAASRRFDSAGTAFERSNGDLEALDPKPCEADVASS